MKPRLVIAGFALLTGWHAAAADWPQILGPNRNGVYSGTDLTTAWPKGGPKTLWKVATGAGFSGPAVADGKVIVFDRSGDEERVTALDARSGRYAGGDLLIGPDATAARFAGDDATWFSVVSDVEPVSSEGEALVEDIRRQVRKHVEKRRNRSKVRRVAAEMSQRPAAR